jgi:hypothetical protein
MKQQYQLPLAQVVSLDSREAVLQGGSQVIPAAALLPFDNGMEVMAEETYVW